MKKRTFSKILSVFLAVAMLFGVAPLNGFTDLKLPDLFSISASAATYSGKCGGNVNWSLDTETGVLDITGTGAMEDYYIYVEPAPWYDYRGCVKMINIQKGVTSIGEYAFYNCYCLKSVIIPENVTSVGDHAFSSCHSLISITVDSDNKNYSSDEYGVLYDKDKTILIQYPEDNNKKTFEIPENVTSIGVSAFCDCDSLTTITIPEGVTSIGDHAFQDCDSLTSITIPESVTSIGDYAFTYCIDITSITVDSENKNYCSDKYGVLYSKNKTTLIQYPIGNSRETFTIPKGVTSIGDFAFVYCHNIELIIIPESVTSIGDYAFCSCNSLSAVYYTGTEDEWRQISIGKYNEDLVYATIHLKITVTLTDSYGNVVSEKVIDGDLDEYTFEGIEDGEYKVTVSQPFHAAKEYDVVASDGKVTCQFSLSPLGDVDGNGKINITDYTAVLKHVKKTSSVEGYAFDCADVTGDGKVTVLDYSAVLRHVKKTSSLW